MRTPLLTLSLLASAALPAQNLVANPGFEEHGKNTKFDYSNGFKTAEVKGWFQPTAGTSDFYHIIDGGANQELLTSVTGNIGPNTGDCCGGFFALAAHDYTEYVGGTLLFPLEKGKTYTISFALALGPDCDQGVSAIGVSFTKERTRQPNAAPLKQLPNLTFDSTATGKVCGDWQIFTGQFRANGGELFFIIGNFTGKKVALDGKHEFAYAYYLIDDVSVTAGDAPAATVPVKTTPAPEKPAPPSFDESWKENVGPGKTLVLHTINFETGKAELLPMSYPPLYALLAALNEQPNLEVVVCGHTDSTGTAASNQVLSEARTKAVADFLIANGIAASRITCKGYGSSKPIGEDLSKNRRVEFVFSE